MEPKKTEERMDKQVFWREHLERMRATGLSQAEYCRRHGLKWYQLHYWRKKLRQESLRGKLRLVPLRVMTSGQESREKVASCLRLSLKGVTIEVEDDFNATTLRRVIETVRTIGC